LQLRPEPIKHQNDYDLFDHPLAESFIKTDQFVLQENQPSINEEWLTTLAGVAHIFKTQKTPFINSSGETQGIVGVGQDLAAQKHIEKQLRRSEITYRNIITTAQDGFVIVSVDGRIIESEFRQYDGVYCR
jgi:PAS domain-containing protein